MSFLAVIAFACLSIMPQLHAQTVTGTIVGTVRDQQGAVIPNAAVTTKNTDTGAERNATADSSGRFNIVSVPAGS
jgi:hypothetical protein